MQLQDFLSKAGSIPASQVLHTEESFEFKVGETTVVGRIDRIDQRPDGTVAIIDYKTGKARDQESADESLQLSLYAIAAKEKWKYSAPLVTPALARMSDRLAPLKPRSSNTTAAASRMKVLKSDSVCSVVSRSLCPEKEKRIPRLVRVSVT